MDTGKNNIIPKVGERVEVASRYIPICDKLLDIGCGDGILSQFLKNKVNYIYGIDSDTELLRKAEDKYNFIKQCDIDREDIGYEQNFFNCVTCLDVIEHIKDPNKLLINIHKILKDKGLLIISTPNIRFSNHIYSLVFKGIFPKTSTDISCYDGGHIHFFTYRDLRDLLYKHNFKILEEEGIINKKKRGWKGMLLSFLIGKRYMNEFRSPGILLVAQKV